MGEGFRELAHWAQGDRVDAEPLTQGLEPWARWRRRAGREQGELRRKAKGGRVPQKLSAGERAPRVPASPWPLEQSRGAPGDWGWMQGIGSPEGVCFF